MNKYRNTALKVMTNVIGMKSFVVLRTKLNNTTFSTFRTLSTQTSLDIVIINPLSIDLCVVRSICPIVVSNNRIATGSSQWLVEICLAVSKDMTVRQPWDRSIWDLFRQDCLLSCTPKNSLARCSHGGYWYV